MKSRLSFLATALLGLAPAVAPAAEIELSDRLTKIAGHLEAGGENGVHFAVTDTKDDLKDLALLIDKLLVHVPDNELPKSFKVVDLFQYLGLNALQGRGSSCHKLGENWQSRSFVLTDGKHDGLFSIFGQKATKPIAHDFAPAGADLVLETTLDLRQFGGIAKNIGSSIGGRPEQEVLTMLKQDVKEVGMTIAEIFADLTVRGTIVLWLDDKKTFEIQRGLTLPVPHLTARMDNAGLLWKFLKKQLDKQGAGQVKITQEGTKTFVRSPNGPEQTPFGEIDPTFIWDSATKQITIGLTMADLEVSQGNGPKITTSESYQKATAGFPAKNNSLAYVSSDVFRLVEVLAKELTPMAEQEVQPFIEALLPYLTKLGVGGGYAASVSMEEDGILAVGNFPFPVKSESGLGLGGITSVAVLSGLATPAVLKAKKNADKVKHFNNLRELGISILDYEEEKGKTPTSLDQLVSAGVIDREFSNTLEEADVVFAPKPAKTRGRYVLAYAYHEDQALVLMSDISTKSIPAWELEELLQAQK